MKSILVGILIPLESATNQASCAPPTTAPSPLASALLPPLPVQLHCALSCPSSHLHICPWKVSEPFPSRSGLWPQHQPAGQSWGPATALCVPGSKPLAFSQPREPHLAAKGNVSPCLRANVSAKERRRAVLLRVEGSSPLQVHGSQALLCFPLALLPQPPTARPRAVLLGGEHCKGVLARLRRPSETRASSTDTLGGIRGLPFASCVTLSS